MTTIEQATQFVARCELPPVPTSRLAIAKDIFDLDPAKSQAAIVGSDLTAFVEGVSVDCRDDVMNASLLGQLVAKKRVPSPSTLDQWKQWYDAYFDAMTQVGFAIAEQGFDDYAKRTDTFEAHEAILEVATALLGGVPTALAAITATLTALKKLDENSPWLTLFNRESQRANTARFQVTVADEQAGKPTVSLLSFSLQATTKLTQVLFFKFRSNDVALQYHFAKVSIQRDVVASVRAQVAQKLSAHASEYIRGLDI
jgi:hypothetical protein